MLRLKLKSFWTTQWGDDKFITRRFSKDEKEKQNLPALGKTVFAFFTEKENKKNWIEVFY